MCSLAFSGPAWADLTRKKGVFLKMRLPEVIFANKFILIVKEQTKEISDVPRKQGENFSVVQRKKRVYKAETVFVLSEKEG